ncbi:MAG: SHOCT domain-containing protein [Leptospiraceae bacterium]|nr:SHOCT domain-containing protein [Leptospiraceae bacterium]
MTFAFKLSRILPGTIHRTLPIALVVLLSGCTSFYQMESLSYRRNLALFKLPAADYPSDSGIRQMLPPMRPYPELEPDQVRALLGNLRFRREHVWGDLKGRVFYPGELNYMAPQIARELKQLDEKTRLVIISRFDPDRSVLSRHHRTTLMFWVDEAGYNLCFGEIQEEYSQSDFELDREWTEILPISMNRSFPDLELLPGPDFTFKDVNGHRHLTWVVFPPDALEHMQYIPEDSNQTETESAEPEPQAEQVQPAEQAEPGPTPTERLRELNQALEEGLITQEEYERKRAEIMSDF